MYFSCQTFLSFMFILEDNSVPLEIIYEASVHAGIVWSPNVTRPAKTGHVGTNYTLSYYRPYLSIGTEYLHSVTCIINPIKCLLSGKTFIAIAHRY